MLCARRDPAWLARFGPPQPFDVLAGEDHRGVESDDREPSCHVEDRPDDLLADLGLEEIELCRVVPREARAVVAVVDVAGVAAPAVRPLEHDGGVAVVPVVVLEHDRDTLVVRQVRPIERVRREGRLWHRQEPVRVVDDPARVDAHVVGDHVAGEPDPARPTTVAEVRAGTLAAEVLGDPIVVERIGRGGRVGVAASPLDGLGRLRALPQPDQPEPGDAPAGERVELLVRDRVERADRPCRRHARAGRARRTCSWRSGRRSASTTNPRRTPRAPRERARRTAPRHASARCRRSGGGSPAPPRPGCRGSGPVGR